MVILEHFCESAHGRDGHGHASKSKDTLKTVKKKGKMWSNKYKKKGYFCC
jgi:hypothetical protein